jgi:2-hydroxy-3-oxopropionate reductase
MLARASTIFTMLPDGPEVEEVVLGANGILEGCQSGSLIIDMSSINPLVSQKVAAACAAKNVEFLDAPVSGGEPKAVAGTLAIMVGGSEKIFRQAEPLLLCMGSSATLTGPVGAGNVTKLANQIMVACNIAAMGEALALSLIDRNFKPGFTIRLHQKDLRNALLAAETNQVFLLLTALVQQMLLSLMGDKKGSSITRLLPRSSKHSCT